MDCRDESLELVLQINALTLWGKNLTDEVFRVSANPVATLWNFARYGAPRSIGVRAKFNY